MKKGLVIVESPTKTRTLKKYLGNNYEIKASVGHVKDLPPRRIGVNIEKDFEPEYEVIRGKGKIIKELKSAAAKAEEIYLATDPDREGEAIAWHIAEELKNGRKKKRRFHRVLFHELTERAIKEAMSHPGELDKNRFESQQARRILDRLVGYQISPLLWEKVKRGLSAGRVQSVAVRMICDREKEIRAFVPEEYWTVTALLKATQPPPFEAQLIKIEGKKAKISNEEAAQKITQELGGLDFTVVDVQKKTRKKNAPAPFITSTLQQEAARKLGFSAKKTMMLAQRLYEGVDLGEEGPVGLITYMRTDSTRVSQEAIKEARAHIAGQFGKDYVPASSRNFKKGKLAQDAHEAIRPTSVMREPSGLKAYLEKDALALYELIWKRFLASQMSPALLDQTRIDIEAGPYLLRATGTVVKFPGFMILYKEAKDKNGLHKKGDGDKVLPPVEKGMKLELVNLEPKQHFTQPPPRYSEASLIKALEEKGIGRPSTYATILSTIQDKEYVKLENKRFVPTELGMLITDLLVAHFPEILDTSFTAAMEKDLDNVEEGSISWVEVLKNFYGPFKERLSQAKIQMESVKAKGVETDIKCDKCGSPMVIKYGRNGEFLACSAYPDCKNIKDFVRNERGEIEIVQHTEEIAGTCEKCGRPMVIKKGRYGKFLACSGYPECKNTQPISTGVRCPEKGCDGELLERTSRRGKVFYSCSRYPECKFATWDKPVAQECPECGYPILVEKNTKRDGNILKCLNKKCRYQKKLD